MNSMSSLLITLQRNRDYVNLQLLKTPAVAWARDKERAKRALPKYWSLIIGHCFVFDFWPLAIDIDFAFGQQPRGTSLLWWELSLSASLYIYIYLSLCVLPAVRLRKLQTPLMFCFSSVCVFFFLSFLCVPHFDHELEANLVCLSFQWARQKPNSDSVSNSNSPIQFLFVTHSNVLFDWASNGLNNFNLGCITEGWRQAKRVPYRESFLLCDKKSIPLAQSKRVHQLKPSGTTTFHWLQL